MSKYLFSILLCTLCALIISCSNSNSKPVPPPPPPSPVTSKLVFETLIIDYGTVEQGSETMRQVRITNTGSTPIMITNARGSCGCLVPSYSKTPVQPGASDIFQIRYDTQRVGPFSKTVFVTTNENGGIDQTITVKGSVNPKPSEESVPANPKR